MHDITVLECDYEYNSGKSECALAEVQRSTKYNYKITLQISVERSYKASTYYIYSYECK